MKDFYLLIREDRKYRVPGILNYRALIPGRLTLLTLFVLLLFPGCSERPPDNPFDPNFNDTVVELSLDPQETRVRLQWRLTRALNGITGFRIYRSTDTPDSFAVHDEVGPQMLNFTDNAVQQGRWYYYRVSILGPSIESNPSLSKRTYLGPGSYWVLSQDDFRIHYLSYDLLSIKAVFEIAFRPAAWTVNPGETDIWLAYGQFIKSLGLIDKREGIERQFRFDEIDTPVAIVADLQRSQVILLDNADDRLLIYNGDSITQESPLATTGNYLAMSYFNNKDQLLLLAENALVQVNNSGQLEELRHISIAENYTAVDMFVDNDLALVLAGADLPGQSRIYRIDGSGMIVDSLQLAGEFYQIEADRRQQRIYVAEAHSGSDDRIVQLSYDGSRQFELSTGFNRISDIKVNPVDQSLIVIDILGNLIYLFDDQGRLISRSLDLNGASFLFHPSRVFIE